MESLYIKPTHPKNGSRYISLAGLFEFRFGTWVKIGPGVLEIPKISYG